MDTFQDTRSPEQIRKDRWGALAVVVAFLLIVLLVALATIFGEPASGNGDFWYYMP